MKFWDASAIVPLLVEESTTPSMQSLLAKDPAMLVWWGTAVECASAISRLERDGFLDESAASRAFHRLREMASAWHEIEPTDTLRDAGIRFVRVHPLRAADSLQLAAAYIGSGRQPAALEIVTLDDRLAAAARKEGFPLVE